MADRDSPTVQTHMPPSEDPTTPRPSAKSIGTHLGRYTIIKLIGRGGVGAVYEADDPELDRRVAIKVLRDDGAGNMDGLRREAQALAKLVHQNVVMVYDVGISGGEVFLVMQLVPGVTIDKWVEEAKPTPEQILAKFRQAADGLVAAHAAGLVHCDFKPSNVLVDARGIVHVGDFGLARMMRYTSTPVAGEVARGSAGMTTIAGTPAYMAPEQFQGTVTAASDQFAFCVALWECLAGERPFEDPTSILDPASRGARRPMRRGLRVPKHVVHALERGMALRPADRFPSMDELLAALAPKRSWIRVAALAGAVGLVAGTAIAYLALRRDHVAPPWDGANIAGTQPLLQVGPRVCAFAPAIDRGGKRVLFDRTEGDTVDLYEVPLAGGTPRQLTDAPTWEWRSQPGRRAGEVVHLVWDMETPSKSTIAYLDLDTKRETIAHEVYALDAAVVGDTIYYSPDTMAGIRAVTGKDDRSFIHPAAHSQYFLVSASPKGDKLAMMMSTYNWGAERPCVVDIATRDVECFEHTIINRPTFAPDGKALYFATYDGIMRRDLVRRTTALFAPGVNAEGGLAVSPDGSALVYSSCTEKIDIRDLGGGSDAIVIANENAVAVATSPRGHIAFVRDDRGNKVIVLHTHDGKKTQLTGPEVGNVGSLHFDPTARRIVFATSDPKPGLRIVDIERPGEILQLTNDARDRDPVFTANGYIGYTQGDVDNNDLAFVIRVDGGTPKRLSASSRTVYGSRGDQLLVGSRDGLYWVDPATGVETPGPKLPPGQETLSNVKTSPTGAWVVFRMGAANQELWSLRLAGGEPQRVRRFDARFRVGPPAITDDGHVIAPVGQYQGDLFRIPARSGKTF